MTSTLLSRLNDPEQREAAILDAQSMAYTANEHGWTAIDALCDALRAAWAREQALRVSLTAIGKLLTAEDAK